MQRADVAWKSHRCRLRTSRVAAAVLALVAAGPAAAQTIVMQPGDALRIAVRNEPELSGDFPITEAGLVMLPLLGTMRVAGRPVDEVLEELRTGYTRELAEPDFLVVPLVRVTVTGEARAPGVQFVDPTQTLAEMLVVAGGPLASAKRGVADLVRAGETRRISIEPGSVDLGIQPRSGDRLHLPRRSWVSENLTVFIGAAATVAAAAVTSLILR